MVFEGKLYRDGLNGIFIYNFFKDKYNIFEYEINSYNKLLRREKTGLQYIGMNTYSIVDEKKWLITKIKYGL